MEKTLNDYLEKIDKYLRPMAAFERIDIINEIKSEMLELQAQNELLPEQIIEKLGDPKELAAAYLGESISKSSKFSWKKIGDIIVFYSLVGISSIFILPVVSTLAVGFMFSGIIALAAGMIKFLGFLIGIEVPFVMFQFGSYTLHPVLVFPAAAVMGVLLFLAGNGLWKVTLKYIQIISRHKRK